MYALVKILPFSNVPSLRFTDFLNVIWGQVMMTFHALVFSCQISHVKTNPS